MFVAMKTAKLGVKERESRRANAKETVEGEFMLGGCWWREMDGSAMGTNANAACLG